MLEIYMVGLMTKVQFLKTRVTTDYFGNLILFNFQILFSKARILT